MGRVSDYSGGRYGRTPSATKMDRKKCRIFKCVDCGKVNWVPKYAMSRARVPRCSGCGGPLEETDTSLKERLGLGKAKIAKILNAKSENHVIGFQDAECRVPLYSHPSECRFCHKQFRTTVGLKLHMEDSHGHKDEF